MSAVLSPRVLILAGGLSPDNVAQALDALGDYLPWGVDVATGVESAPGIKERGLVRDFIRVARLGAAKLGAAPAVAPK